MTEIFGALAKAQSKFEAALKSSDNPHFRSKYAALDTCVEAVRTALNENGVFLTQTIDSSEAGVTIETVFAHASGETYSGGKLFIPVGKRDAQGYGSAISYGRRYSLLTACGVAPADSEDDDGNLATRHAPSDDDLYRSFEAKWLPKLREASLAGWTTLRDLVKEIPDGDLKDRLGITHMPSLKAAAKTADATVVA